MGNFLISVVVFIGWLFHWSFFIIGVVITGIVISQLLEERAQRKGYAKAEKELREKNIS